MHHVAHRLGEDKEESRQPNAGKHQEQQVDTSKITPTLRKSLSLLRQTLWKPFRKSAMELDLLPWTGTAPSASSCLAQDALWDLCGEGHELAGLFARHYVQRHLARLGHYPVPVAARFIKCFISIKIFTDFMNYI